MWGYLKVFEKLTRSIGDNFLGGADVGPICVIFGGRFPSNVNKTRGWVVFVLGWATCGKVDSGSLFDA